jgi:hypothetical protein
MTDAAIKGQFAEELAELHDGSISLFVTLPVFRSLLVSEHRAAALESFEALIAEHLAHLDGILGDVLIRRERSDSHLTKSLFHSIAELRLWPATPARDDEIVELVGQAQLFLMGSCSFALRYAKQAGVQQSAYVLQDSLTRLGSLAVQLVASQWDSDAQSQHQLSNAVA